MQDIAVGFWRKEGSLCVCQDIVLSFPSSPPRGAKCITITSSSFSNGGYRSSIIRPRLEIRALATTHLFPQNDFSRKCSNVVILMGAESAHARNWEREVRATLGIIYFWMFFSNDVFQGIAQRKILIWEKGISIFFASFFAGKPRS